MLTTEGQDLGLKTHRCRPNIPILNTLLNCLCHAHPLLILDFQFAIFDFKSAIGNRKSKMYFMRCAFY
jgi:hypothetical protein